MDAIGEIDEGAAPRCGRLLLGRSERDHAFQHGQGDASPHSTQRVTAVDQPGLGKVVCSLEITPCYEWLRQGVMFLLDAFLIWRQYWHIEIGYSSQVVRVSDPLTIAFQLSELFGHSP